MITGNLWDRFQGFPILAYEKMYFWMIPKGFDIGGTVGMFAFNLLIGGMIGSVVLTWRLLMVGTYLLKSIGYGGLWIVRKAFRT